MILQIKQLTRYAVPALAALLPLSASAARATERGGAANLQTVKLARAISTDETLRQVHQMALDLLRKGFNAGSGYHQVWIRDTNTFIEVALEVNPPARMRDALLNFFKFQGGDGNIIDGYRPLDPARVQPTTRLTPLAPGLMGFKNTVEIDQESSLVQAVYKYVAVTGDRGILDERIDDKTVLERLGLALHYVLNHHFDSAHGLVWGATRADWGDVQPETNPGVLFDSHSHRAFCIYDNAMLLIALNDYLQLLGNAPDAASWRTARNRLKANVRKYLWDKKKQKFIPHVYLDGSPFPIGFDENAIYYHGGTAVAIEAGLLSHKEVAQALLHMDADVKAANASSIGLTLYPPYPEGFFKNPQLRDPYSYQNGGDWTWFGGRVIRDLIVQGYVADAYRELKPMVNRVKREGGFYEWWTPGDQPRGSSDFRGSAGVLGRDIELLEAWAAQHD